MEKGKQIVSDSRRIIGDGPSNLLVQEETWLVNGTDGKGWNVIWYVTNEYPRHMTPNFEVFDKFKQDTACSSAISQKGLDVRGLGEITVNTISHKFVIPGALYVTNIGLNVLSLSQLTQQGFEAVIKDCKCTIRSMFDTTSSEETSDVDSAKELDTSSNRDEENDGDAYMEERVGLDGEKEKAIRPIMRYYDSLYFKNCAITTEGEGSETPSKNEFESLIGFLHMVHEQEIHDGCKDLVVDHFAKLVKWFYKEIMQCEERPIPVKINDTEVCLLDLYLTVKGMGGHARVSIKNNWTQMAYAIGFPKEFEEELKECYVTHLSLLAAYYEVAKDYSVDEVVPKAMECEGTSGVEAGSLSSKETTQYCEGTDARHMDLDGEEGIQGRIEYDDGDTLIISFEEDIEVSDDEKDEVKNSNSEDNMIVID